MSIITVADLQNYMGITFTGTQTTQAGFIVDFINDYINNETDTSFGLVTGEVMRVKADLDGNVIFQNIPIQLITLVHDVYTNLDFASDGWIFDGIDTLYPFYPGQILDITLNYGVTPVPKAIIGVALAMAKRAMGELLANTGSGLLLKQVGDVIYQFGDVLTPNKVEQSVLDGYSSSEYTIRVDPKGTYLTGKWQGYPVVPNVSFLP